MTETVVHEDIPLRGKESADATPVQIRWCERIVILAFQEIEWSLPHHVYQGA